MTDETHPARKTYLQSGEICVTVEDDRLEAKERNDMAFDLLKRTSSITLETRKKMGLDR